MLKNCKGFFFCRGSTARVGLGLLCEAPRLQSVGLLWSSDQPNAEAATWRRS